MTKKDYKLIAVGLRNGMPSRDPLFYRDLYEWRLRTDQWEIAVDAMTDVLAAENPRFDRFRFIAACRGE